MFTRSAIILICVFALSLSCGKETIEPEFSRPPLVRETERVFQPGVTAFRIVAPKPKERIFALDLQNSTPLTIRGEQFTAVVVTATLKINQDGNAVIIQSDFPKKSAGRDIIDILKTWNRFTPHKSGIIKYLINTGGREFKIDVRGLSPKPEFINDKIVDGELGRISSHFTNVDYDTKLDF